MRPADQAPRARQVAGLGDRDARLLLTTRRAALAQQITWYLAVDQFGYLNFAHDLLHGQIFHDVGAAEGPRAVPSAPAPTCSSRPTSTTTGGSTAATRRASRSCSRGGSASLGDDRAHYLNPTLYLGPPRRGAGLPVARRSARRGAPRPGPRSSRSSPPSMYLWGLTLTRDLSAHVFAFDRASSSCSRCAASPIQPGATRWPPAWRSASPSPSAPTPSLYLRAGDADAGGALVARARRGSQRDRARSPPRRLALGVVVGASPFFAYNWAATGNPFLPTQGMELLDPPVAPAARAQAPAGPPAAPASAAGRVGLEGGIPLAGVARRDARAGAGRRTPARAPVDHACPATG